MDEYNKNKDKYEDANGKAIGGDSGYGIGGKGFLDGDDGNSKKKGKGSKKTGLSNERLSLPAISNSKGNDALTAASTD